MSPAPCAFHPREVLLRRARSRPHRPRRPRGRSLTAAGYRLFTLVLCLAALCLIPYQFTPPSHGSEAPSPPITTSAAVVSELACPPPKFMGVDEFTGELNCKFEPFVPDFPEPHQIP